MAFLVNDHGGITKACYIEAKLRTGAYPSVATEAEEQLAKDMEARYPAILTFVANQILEQHPLSDALRSYIHRRNRGEVLDEFRLHLTWETSTWSELALERLRDANELLKPLDVCVVRVSELDTFISNVYALAGIEIEDGDD